MKNYTKSFMDFICDKADAWVLDLITFIDEMEKYARL